MNISKQTNFGLRGRARVSVINPVRGEIRGEWQPNLILDRGMDQIASTSICDIFRVGIKGTNPGNINTKETVTGTYTMLTGFTTVNRVSGARGFGSDDLGRRIKFSGGHEAKITQINSATSVEAYPAPTADVTTESIVLYYVEQVELENETGRTITYSTDPGQNGTTTVDNVRTFLRTFIFGTENLLVRTFGFNNFYTQEGTTVTRTQGTHNFDPSDVGKTIRYRDNGYTAEIVSYTDATHVEVDVSMTISEQCIDFLITDDLKETPDISNTYSRAGNVVTRVTGARNFTADDVGKVIYFLNDQTEGKITVFTDVDEVQVDSSGTLAAQNIDIYEYNTYKEVGFSHSEEIGGNVNIRVILDSPVKVNGATPITPSDQLKVEYELELQISPTTVENGTMGIVDPGNDMSGNKSGAYTIESFATSRVASDGTTDLSFSLLEPSMAGYLALSKDTAALAPLETPTRADGVVFTPFVPNEYVAGDFYKFYVGTFPINEAIGTEWRSLMLFDPNTDNAIFTFLFNSNQRKDSSHSLSITMAKVWSRILT